MALVIGAKIYSSVYLSGGYRIKIVDVPTTDTFSVMVYNTEKNYSKGHSIRGDVREEVVPEVFLSAGDSGCRNSLARMVFEAPQSIKINRKSYKCTK